MKQIGLIMFNKKIFNKINELIIVFDKLKDIITK